MSAPTRPVLRYHGGKWRLAPWILTFFPAHRMYVEPFGGGGSVLMRKERVYAEVYNDLDSEVVNVFRVLRDPESAKRLTELLMLTPFARVEFEDAYTESDEPIDQARRTVVKAFMGFGSAAIHDTRASGFRSRASTWRPPTGFRSNSNRSGTTPAHDWSHYPEQLAAFCDRLSGVIIENREATMLIPQHDNVDALFYVDPPYPLATRADAGHDYTHEMSDDDHRALAEALRSVRGSVVLSGYPCDLYDVELYSTWQRHERAHLADGAAKRTEVVWLNARCVELLASENPQHRLGIA